MYTKNFIQALIILFISVSFCQPETLEAQNNEDEIFRFDITDVAFKNDSTMETTEDGWSEWIETGGKVILNTKKSEMTTISNGTKNEFYIYEAKFDEPNLYMNAVDYEGDDVEISLINKEGYSELYLYYQSIAYVFLLTQ